VVVVGSLGKLFIPGYTNCCRYDTWIFLSYQRAVVAVVVGSLGKLFTFGYTNCFRYDTWIFLVSRREGQLYLNSSLVRISLNNIERTEAAVNGTPALIFYLLI